MSASAPPQASERETGLVLPYARRLAGVFFLLAWAFGGFSAALWAEGLEPGPVVVLFVSSVLALAAMVAVVVGRPPALSVTAEGVRINLRLRRWTDIEALERAGTAACPALKVRLRGRRRPVGSISQQEVRGDLLAVASQVENVWDKQVIGQPKPGGRRRPTLLMPAVILTVVLILTDVQFLPGLWVRAPGSTANAYDRLRPLPPSEPRGAVTVLSARDQTATVLDLLRFASGAERVDLGWYNPFRPGRVPAGDDPSATRSAVAAGLACAGHPVEVQGGEAEIVLVRPDSPANGRLHLHERIVSVGGSPVRFKEDVFAALVGWDLSRPAALVVEGPDGRQRTEMLLVDRGRAGVWGLAGVGVDRRPMTVATTTTFDFDGFQGDSSGLAAAVTVFDSETPGTLVPPGINVAMTGSVSPTGVVGPVGSIPEKMAAALKAGAATVLVPAELADHARQEAGGGLRVVGVHTLAEAIFALGGSGCD